MRTNESRSPVKMRGLRSIAIATGLVLLPTACSNTEGKATETTVVVPTTEISQIDERARIVKEATLRSASAVLDILERSGSGAEQYAGDTVGNKRAIIGPDGVYPSADDNRVPETFVRLTQRGRGNKLTFNSTQMVVDEAGERHFPQLHVALLVQEGNPILTKTEQLTLADFREALADSRTLSFEYLEGRVYQPGTNEEELNREFSVDPYESLASATTELRYADMAADQLSQ